MRFFQHQEAARTQTLRLMLLFAGLLVLLVLAVNGALALAWHLLAFALGAGLADSYPRYFFQTNTGITLLFVLGGWWIESLALQDGGEKLARRAGAREAWPASRPLEQKFCNTVAELAIAAAMRHTPLPMVLPRDTSINAFAAGWGEIDAVIVVTQGALEQLNRDELQGLVAHEISHLREGDTRLNMRLAGMVSGLSMLYTMGCSMCSPDANGQRSFLALPGFAIAVAGSFGWVAGRILQAAVSRQREFLADARAVQFTRSKEGLGGVLRKVQSLQQTLRHPDRHQQEEEKEQEQEQEGQSLQSLSLLLSASPMQLPAVQHMLLVSADRAAARAQPGHAAQRWLASHPPLSERIRRIYGRTMPSLTLGLDQPSSSSTAAFQETHPL